MFVPDPEDVAHGHTSSVHLVQLHFELFRYDRTVGPCNKVLAQRFALIIDPGPVGQLPVISPGRLGVLRLARVVRLRVYGCRGIILLGWLIVIVLLVAGRRSRLSRWAGVAWRRVFIASASSVVRHSSLRPLAARGPRAAGEQLLFGSCGAGRACPALRDDDRLPWEALAQFNCSRELRNGLSSRSRLPPELASCKALATRLEAKKAANLLDIYRDVLVWHRCVVASSLRHRCAASGRTP